MTRLKNAARRYPGNDGRPLIEDARFRDRLAWADLELKALEIVNLKLLSMQGDKAITGPEASILKIIGSQVHQNISELAMRAMGPYASRDPRVKGEPPKTDRVAAWHHPSDDSLSP